MPFKEDVTQNIYTSWMQTAGYDNVGYLRRLESFSDEELVHLGRCLEEEQRVRRVKDNGS